MCVPSASGEPPTTCVPMASIFAFTSPSEKRYAALIAWGAHYDYHAVWLKRWEVMRKSERGQATSHFQLPWVLGEPDMESAMEKLKKFTLAGVADRIECPIVICHGEDDVVSP